MNIVEIAQWLAAHQRHNPFALLSSYFQSFELRQYNISVFIEAIFKYGLFTVDKISNRSDDGQTRRTNEQHKTEEEDHAVN